MSEVDNLLGRLDDVLAAEEKANQAERGNRALRARAPELVLELHRAGHLGYLAASDEWVDQFGGTLIPPLQEAAHALAVAGQLPVFAEWFPAPTYETCPPRPPEPPFARQPGGVFRLVDPRGMVQARPPWWRRLFRRG